MSPSPLALGFTLFTWLYVLVSVLRSQGLPDIPENFYTLMGISSTAYIGGKLSEVVQEKPQPDTGASSTADIARSPFERSLTDSQVRRLQNALGIAASGVMDRTTREAVKTFKLSHGIAPASGRVDSLVFERITTASA